MEEVADVAVAAQAERVRAINDPENSDLVFVCGDGIAIHASRRFCMGRSGMVDAMLKTEMSELVSSTVKLPDIHSPTLLTILEYLYCGDICHYLPINLTHGQEVIAASRFFLLPNHVEQIAGRCLIEKFHDPALDMKEIAIAFTTAVESKSPHPHWVLKAHAERLALAWMHPDIAEHFSERSVRFIIKCTAQCTCSKESKLSLEEYYLFRGVLTWAIYRYRLNISVDLVDRILPAAKRRLYILKSADYKKVGLIWLPGYDVGHSRDDLLGILETNLPGKEALMRLVQKIQLGKIPSPLFHGTVESLGLISEDDLVELIRKPWNAKVFMSWNSGKYIEVLKRGFCIQSEGTEARSSVAISRMSCGYPNCSWEFSVEKLLGRMQIGFAIVQDRAIVENLTLETTLIELEFPHAAGGSKAVHLIPERYDNHDLVYYQVVDPAASFDSPSGIWSLTRAGYIPASLPIRARFRYDQTLDQCSLSLGEVDVGVIWTNLPKQIYFPAVSLTGEGVVCAALLRGFEVI